MKEQKTCSGCGHFIGLHYIDVLGFVRCVSVDRGISTRGVPGLHCNTPCDCENYVSESANKKRDVEASQQRERDAAVAKIVAGIKENLAQTDSKGRTICTTSGKPIDEHTREINPTTGQQKDYIVLCADERAKGFVRPYRESYKHQKCGTVTTMGRSLSETYARDPKFYGATFCCGCGTHYPVIEFTWTVDGQTVGS